MPNQKNLGKRLKVGETFITTTKRMSKDRDCCKMNKECNGKLITYEVLRQNDERFFVKGKRQYFCRVLGMVQMTVGFWPGSIAEPRFIRINKVSGKRFWQFSYLVQILEN